MTISTIGGSPSRVATGQEGTLTILRVSGSKGYAAGPAATPGRSPRAETRRCNGCNRNFRYLTLYVVRTDGRVGAQQGGRDAQGWPTLDPECRASGTPGCGSPRTPGSEDSTRGFIRLTRPAGAGRPVNRVEPRVESSELGVRGLSQPGVAGLWPESTLPFSVGAEPRDLTRPPESAMLDPFLPP